MFFSRLKKQFRSRFKQRGQGLIPAIWVGDDEDVALIDPDSGRVHAYIWHNGYGTYCPTIIVPPWRALHLIRHEAAALISLLSFPRCTVELPRLETDMTDARDYAEYGLYY
ncbi:hypothetical protein [Bradyrhizobium sp.]